LVKHLGFPKNHLIHLYFLTIRLKAKPKKEWIINLTGG